SLTLSSRVFHKRRRRKRRRRRKKKEGLAWAAGVLKARGGGPRWQSQPWWQSGKQAPKPLSFNDLAACHRGGHLARWQRESPARGHLRADLSPGTTLVFLDRLFSAGCAVYQSCFHCVLSRYFPNYPGFDGNWPWQLIPSRPSSWAVVI